MCAFEGTKAGFQSFLAAKQAGAHPLAQHLNFKSALKEARIAMAAKQLEQERQFAHERGLQETKFEQDKELVQVRSENPGIDDIKKQLEIDRLKREAYEATPEGALEKAEREGKAKSKVEAFSQNKKLLTGMKRIAKIKEQFDVALPDDGRTPLGQRIKGITSNIGAKTGLIPNSKLLALNKNSRLMAINIIRMFGEVGNLSRAEQQSAMDAVSQAGLTEQERWETVKQLSELALSGADQEVVDFLLQDENIRSIVDSFEIDISVGGSLPQAQGEVYTLPSGKTISIRGI